tara:strand:+ start:445 stop:945 length:501 start_codon:yes stop_codon:yes gene_type:complete
MKLRKKFTLRSGNSPFPFDFTGANNYEKSIESSSDNPNDEANKPVKGSEVNLDESSEFSGKKDKEKSKQKYDFSGKGKTKEEQEKINKERQEMARGKGNPTGLGGKELTGINKEIVNTIVGGVSPDNALEAIGFLGGASVLNYLKNVGSKAYQGAKAISKIQSTTS